jgi:xylulokinase
MGYLIGIDVGSQSVKGILLSPEAEGLGLASSSCRMTHPAPGWADQAPSEWQAGIRNVVGKLVQDAGLPRSAVTHMGLACQVDGVVPIDRSGVPLRDGIIWLDRRATVESRCLAEEVGPDKIFAITGLNPDASHIAPKIMWLCNHEPELYRTAAKMAPVAGFLLAWMTGSALQDHANASSTLLYDVRARDWAAPMLAATQIDPELLCGIRAAHDVGGTLLPEVAEELGVSSACQVVIGTGDDHAASLGAGAAFPGIITDVTGTAEPVTAVAAELVFDEEHVVETHAHAVDGELLVENPGFVSGGSTLWLSSNVLGVTQGQVFECAAAAPAGSDGVVFLPTLSGSTAPRWNDEVRGVFAGLSLNHDRSHLARAVLEGCAFALRDIVARLDAMGLGGGEIRVVGGGARSQLWLQIKADVTGKPIRPVLSPEPTALGAAILAGLAAGTFVDAAAAVDRVVELGPEQVVPRAEVADCYERCYGRYRRLFDAVEGCRL